MFGAAGFRGQAQPARVHVILGDEVTCSDGIPVIGLILKGIKAKERSRDARNQGGRRTRVFFSSRAQGSRIELGIC